MKPAPITKFQGETANPNGAQIVFTTHNTELMNLELLRKDQLYFVDKRDKDGASELYTISEFSTRTTENIRKGYLVGKYGATPDVEIEEVGKMPHAKEANLISWCSAKEKRTGLHGLSEKEFKDVASIKRPTTRTFDEADNKFKRTRSIVIMLK